MGRISTEELPLVVVARLLKMVSAIEVPWVGSFGSGWAWPATEIGLSRKLSKPLPRGWSAVSTRPTIMRPSLGGGLSCNCGGGGKLEPCAPTGVAGRSIEKLLSTEATSGLE